MKQLLLLGSLALSLPLVKTEAAANQEEVKPVAEPAVEVVQPEVVQPAGQTKVDPLATVTKEEEATVTKEEEATGKKEEEATGKKEEEEKLADQTEAPAGQPEKEESAEAPAGQPAEAPAGQPAEVPAKKDDKEVPAKKDDKEVPAKKDDKEVPAKEDDKKDDKKDDKANTKFAKFVTTLKNNKSKVIIGTGATGTAISVTLLALAYQEYAKAAVALNQTATFSGFVEYLKKNPTKAYAALGVAVVAAAGCGLQHHFLKSEVKP